MREESVSPGRGMERSGGRRVDGGTYTPLDSEHFEKLADFSRLDAGFGPELKPFVPAEPPVSEPDLFGYSESDERQFEQLMDRLGGFRGARRPATTRGRAKASAGRYTASDDHLFADLMAAGRFPAGSGSADPDPAPARVPDGSVFQYTLQDIEEFRKVMPDPAAEIGAENDDGRGRPFRPDRDVGHIRIVDFDRERDRQRQSKRRGKADIKVRYFD